jgi:hypothetical protein
MTAHFNCFQENDKKPEFRKWIYHLVCKLLLKQGRIKKSGWQIAFHTILAGFPASQA